MIRRRACAQGEAGGCVQLLPFVVSSSSYNTDDIVAIILIVTLWLCGFL